MLGYGELTHRGQFQRLAKLARAALRDYDISPDSRLTPLRHIENTTFRVDDPSTGRRYCLRIHRPDYQSVPAIRSEILFLDSLARETALIVPRPIVTRSGDLLTYVAIPGIHPERTVVLFGWVEGRFLRKRIPVEAVARSAETLAGLQDFGAQFQPPPNFTRPHLEESSVCALPLSACLDIAGVIAPLTPENRALIERAAEQALRVQTNLGRGGDVYGLIHADFHRGNFLIAPGGVVAVIDFDDCCWGHYLFDIAAATLTYASDPAFTPLYAAFLTGYRRVRPLSDEQEKLLPTFHFLRRLFLFRWMVRRTDNPMLRTYVPKYTAELVAGAARYLR